MGVNDQVLVMRLPKNLMRRAQKLARKLAARPEYTGVRMTQSTAMRLAIQYGLDSMEEQLKKK